MCNIDLNKKFLSKLKELMQKNVLTDIPQSSLDTNLLDTDRFFIVDLDVTINTTSWQPSWLHDFSGFSEKYSESVDLLYKSFCDNLDNKMIVYPLIYLARHTLELRLKTILLLKGHSIADLKTHSIKKLWSKLSECGIIDDQNILNVIGVLIDEFDDKDKTSDAFRYPRYKDGNTTKNFEIIDIKNFYVVFKKIDNLFYGIESKLLDEHDM